MNVHSISFAHGTTGRRALIEHDISGIRAAGLSLMLDRARDITCPRRNFYALRFTVQEQADVSKQEGVAALDLTELGNEAPQPRESDFF